MDIAAINFNENLEKESNLDTNKSNFTLNLNPYMTDVRHKQKIDYYSLEYLKEISKSVTLARNNSAEGGENFINKNSSPRKQISIMKKNRKSKVTFKDNIIEPEKDKKGNFILKILKK